MHSRFYPKAACVVGSLMALALPQTALAQTSAYQKTADAIICDKGQCNVVFPKVGANKELTLLFVSCSTRGENLQVGDALLGIDIATTPPNLFLGGSRRSIGTDDFFIISQPVVFTIPGGKRPNIKIFFGESTVGAAATCSLSGELVALP